MSSNSKLDTDLCDQIEQRLAELVFENERTLATAIGQLAHERTSLDVRNVLYACVSLCVNSDSMFDIDKKKALVRSRNRYITLAALVADVSALPPGQDDCLSLITHWASTKDQIFNAPRTLNRSVQHN